MSDSRLVPKTVLTNGRALLWWTTLITVVALLLRLLGARGDWWLDEIWAYRDAARLRAWWEAFSVLKVDSNHPLNTIVQYLCGPTRVVSIVAGTASVVLAGWWARCRRDEGDTDFLRPVVCMLMFALATPRVIWGSEARGYGTAVFSVLLSLVSLDRAVPLDQQTPLIRRFWWGFSYGVALIVGMVSHLAFLSFLITALAWSAALVAGRTGAPEHARWKRVALLYIELNALPVVFAAVYWFGFVSQLGYTGGPTMPVSTLLAQTSATLLGWPTRVLPGALVFGGVIVVLAIALLTTWRRGAFPDFVLYSVGIFVAPLVMIVVRAMTSSAELHVYPRYFVTPLTLAFLLLAETITDALRADHRGRRVLFVGVGLLLLVMHGVGDVLFLRDGRGQYTAALRDMAKTGDGSRPITLIGDHKLRTRMVVDWHVRQSPGLTGRIGYVSETSSSPPDFFVVNLADPADAFPPSVRMLGMNYVYSASYKHYGLSGLTWVVYRRANL